MKHGKQTSKAVNRFRLVIVSFIASMMSIGSLGYSQPVTASHTDEYGEPVLHEAACGKTLTANVVAIDQSIMFNRLGAQNVNWMVYALERDVIRLSDSKPLSELNSYGSLAGLPQADREALRGNVALRPDKRPRPLVLRVAAGDCLRVNLTNLLTPMSNPLDLPNPQIDNGNPLNANQGNDILFIDNQVDGRWISFHPLGMQLVDDIDDDGSYVGVNGNSLIAPGESDTYTYFGEAENAYMVYSRGQPFGGEASGGNVGVGLFGVVNVEPKGARFYRSQVTEEEMRLATKGYQDGSPMKTYSDDDGYWGDQPIIDYGATYPDEAPWNAEGKAGLPILNMVDGYEIVHSDINAIIAGPNEDGTFPPETYPLESVDLRNPVLPNRLEAFREFTVVFHDETGATQAFPKWFDHPILGHTLHGVRDSFMINYGSGGIGSEIIANRLRVGPMWDCLNCAYEEFFLSAYTVGDSAMLVDVPANANLELCTPEDIPGTCIGEVGGPNAVHGIKATQAYFPDDPSNVHHSYKRDFVKFRNVHAGPKEQHIFHLHNHQWLFNPNDDNSNYIDAQGIGPGSGYTYEINFWGSGNRNISAGDAIFHCHFYPHFAQGMWEMWRIHDVYETGTELAASGVDTYGNTGIHDTPFALQSGLPAEGARALPDGEIIAGTPIPGLVPLPGVALPPMPGAVVTVEPKLAPDGVTQTASVAKVHRVTDPVTGKPVDPYTGAPIGNPGYPFWIAGIEHTVGQRPTTPPLDMITETQAENLVDSGDPLWSHPGFVAGAGGWDGGLPRHTLEGYLQGGESVNVQNRLDFTKVVEKAKPVYFPEEGTDLEQLVMAFNAKLYSPSWALNLDGSTTPAQFQTNGQLPVPSAPYYEPCRDDQGDLFTGTGEFWGPVAGSYITNDIVSTKNAITPRVYMGANIQIDAVLNKVGYHFPQQRIIALWEDVMPTILKDRAPEPLVMRSNTYDCVKYLHTNLVPEYYELDDYQVRTPTDIIGQHIHLPKWDLVSNDGSGNGWNYEDGTLSPGAVRERIHAINNFLHEDPECDFEDCLHPAEHPFFNAMRDGQAPGDWMGARTTIQRWFTDPVFNAEVSRNQYGEVEDILSQDRGLGIIFTHDHYGPSTHQQVGLYATILAEPAGSTWKHNETGEPMATRDDGGPTSWQAVIEPLDQAPFREFYFEFGDFQHAYEAGTYVGIGNDGELTAAKDEDGIGVDTHSPVTSGNGVVINKAGMDIVLTPPAAPDGALTFLKSINPSFRQEPKDKADVFPDIVRFPPECPNIVNGQHDPATAPLRPCPEAISADDVGMLVTNYRNEPLGLRVFDPNKAGPDGNDGTQADGLAGDLGFALQSRTDRAIMAMNQQPGAGTVINGTKFPPPINTGAVEPGDPFTPLVRTYPGDKVKIKIQAGSTEHEHNATIHGVKWRQAGSGHGQAPNSGWRNAQNDGISEQFTFDMPVGSDIQNKSDTTDYAYATDSSQDGWWTGMWGIMRAYDNKQPDLVTLPNNDNPKPGRIINTADFDGVCPLYVMDQNGDKVLDENGYPIPTPVREYTVVAMTANQILGNKIGAKLVPDDPSATMHEGAPVDPYGGTLVYNNRSGGQKADKADGTAGGPSNGLHDPTALLYVNLDDLQEVGADKDGYKQSQQCKNSKGLPGVLRTGCNIELKPGAPIEPVAIRGAAGDCIQVTLYNKLPQVAPDLAGYNTLLQVVNRRVDGIGSLRTFQNNLVRPSSHVGLHAQLVEYDATQHDGVNVGLNIQQTVGPVNPDGTLDKAIIYKWFAGHHHTRVATAGDCTKYGVRGKGCGKGNDLVLAGIPVEFGGFNLMPADKIKHGQKGLVGAGVILPKGATWNEDVTALEQVQDHQAAAASMYTRGTRLAMEVNDGAIKDAALVFQKGLNHRFGDGTAVPNIASEGQGIPEDSHDAGQMAINYGTEPMWFRFGLKADADFGRGPGGLGAVTDSHLAYSNSKVGGDPVTPVITAAAGQDIRIRVLEPTGAGRGTTFNLDGHAWQRDPYVCDGSKDGLNGRCATTEAAAPTRIGHNPIGFVLGHQESVTPGAHFDIVPLNGAGGVNRITGDFLFADQGSFGPTSGLWGILRVE